MNYIIINVSPRTQGTSRMIAEYIEEKLREAEHFIQVENLYQRSERMEELLQTIRNSDCIILSGPCYVASYPAGTLELLEKMSEKEGILHGQSLYGFMQGGMPYIHTHEHGIKLLENYAAANALHFKGGFVMGGGAILNGGSLDKVIGARKVVPAIHVFIQNILTDKESPKELYQNAAWNIRGISARIMACLLNQMVKRNLKKNHIHYKAANPYLRSSLHYNHKSQ